MKSLKKYSDYIIATFILILLLVIVHILSKRFKIVHTSEYIELQKENDSLLYTLNKYSDNIEKQEFNIKKLENKIFYLDSVRTEIENNLININHSFNATQDRIDKVPVDSSYSYDEILSLIGKNKHELEYCFDDQNTRTIHKKIIELEREREINKKLEKEKKVNVETIDLYKQKTISLNKIVTNQSSMINNQQLVIINKDKIIEGKNKEIKHLRFWNTTFKITTVVVPLAILIL